MSENQSAFKKTVQGIVLFTAMFCLSLAQASDSSTFAPPSVNSNSVFVLDQGQVDSGGRYSSNSGVVGWGIGTGVCSATPSDASSGGFFLCDTTPIYTNKQCPTGFNPYFVVIPYKGEEQAQGWYGLCVTSYTTIGSAYAVYVRGNINRGAAGGNMYIGTSVHFTTYCYPASIPVPTYDTACSPPTASIFSPPVLMWDSGYILQPSYSSARPAPNQTVTTNRVCPPGYSVYATIASGYIYGRGNNSNSAGSARDFVNLGGICIRSIITNATSYTINYLAREMVTPITPSTNTLTFDIAVPDTQTYNVVWTVYCYPPGMTAPPVNPNPPNYCDPSQVPFN